MHVTGRVAYRRMCEWCFVCVCISRRADIHTTVTLNVVHTILRSCVCRPCVYWNPNGISQTNFRIFFLLLHRACCRVTQLLHQRLHIYEIYKIYTLKH